MELFLLGCFVLGCMSLVVCSAFLFFWVKERHRRTTLETVPAFDDLMRSLELCMASEIHIYERYLMNSVDGIEINGFLSNSQFINIYNELSKRVIYALSPAFYEMMGVYWTEEETQVYIAQRIYNYLVEKAVPPLDEISEDELELAEESEPVDKDDSFWI